MKINKKWNKRELTNKEIEEMRCKNGSFTCGLLQKLGTGMCKRCKKDIKHKKD